MTRPFVLAALLCALFLPAAASAQQRPLVTEDPETVGAGRVLIEGGCVERLVDACVGWSGIPACVGIARMSSAQRQAIHSDRLGSTTQRR